MTSFSVSTDKVLLNVHHRQNLSDTKSNKDRKCGHKIRLMMTTDDDTGNFQDDGAARIAVLLPVWKQQRCTLECVPQTSTQAAKQQKGEGNCAGHADMCRGRTLSTVFFFLIIRYADKFISHTHSQLGSQQRSTTIQFQVLIQKPRSNIKYEY